MGNNSDPETLHKYLYANADPVNMIDPSGNFSLVEFGVANTVRNVLSELTDPFQFLINFITNGDSWVNIFDQHGAAIAAIADPGLIVIDSIVSGKQKATITEA